MPCFPPAPGLLCRGRQAGRCGRGPVRAQQPPPLQDPLPPDGLLGAAPGRTGVRGKLPGVHWPRARKLAPSVAFRAPVICASCLPVLFWASLYSVLSIIAPHRTARSSTATTVTAATSSDSRSCARRARVRAHLWLFSERECGKCPCGALKAFALKAIGLEPAGGAVLH